MESTARAEVEHGKDKAGNNSAPFASKVFIKAHKLNRQPSSQALRLGEEISHQQEECQSGNLK